MPDSVSNQGSTPGPQNGTSGSENQWSQVQPISPNIVQNGTTLEWRQLPAQNVPVPVSANNLPSVEHITNGISNINGLNPQITFNPPTYVNTPYQRSAISNGYITLNSSRGLNGQTINGQIANRPAINGQIANGPEISGQMANGTAINGQLSNGQVINGQITNRQGITGQIMNGQMINGPNNFRPQVAQAIGGSNWPNQSTFGRYVPQPPTWSSTRSSGGVKKQKRIRTAFTSQQMMELEQEYARARYLDRARRIELADILRLNERTIKIWFQNRRMKEKKDRAESLEDSEEASTSESSPEMSNIQIPMLVNEQYPVMSSEVYNQGGVYIEQFPTSSASASMPINSMSTTMPQPPVQNLYTVPEYITEEQYRAQYQQVQLQMQQYPPTYTNEVQEVAPEPVPQPEAAPSSTVSSDIIERSWDLSWIRSLQPDEEF